VNLRHGVRRFRGIGTTAEIVVTDPSRMDVAERVLRDELRAIDEACSRFRADSEISRLHEKAGTAVEISPLLTQALSAALRAADLTDGLVDPTVGQAVRDLGYDKDFDLLDRDVRAPVAAPAPAPGWWRIRLDTERHEVVLPRGLLLDLGATAKALAADRAAARAADATGCGVLVGLGGDVSVAGRPPGHGWGISVGDDHARTDPQRDPAVAISSGGLATSSIACRSWRRAGRAVHHIVDPRTGDIPDEVWRTVSVTAATCVDANSATTAAIVLGHRAIDWLTELRLPARLVAVDGRVRTVAGWPAE
jgi:thiamine biosynthesis lipoprotein